MVPGREYQVTSAQIAQMAVFYNGQQIGGTGYNGRFIAVSGVSNLELVSNEQIIGSIRVTEYLRNLYNINDGQGGTWAFQPDAQKWISQYTYVPESFSMVGNRLVTFKAGNIYIHNSTTYNRFYGQTSDSVVAFPHNEGGNTIKYYKSIAVEGDTPSRVHVRTEVPNVQSSDLVPNDFKNKEGVKYAPLYRDRLSPNVSGTVIDKLYKGDRIRGEIGKFQVVFSQPSTEKQVKFVDINYDPSTGQTV